jgi:hypothetical protein
MTDPATPILADSRNDVTAASAPAPIWVNDMPLKKFLTLYEGNIRRCAYPPR